VNPWWESVKRRVVGSTPAAVPEADEAAGLKRRVARLERRVLLLELWTQNIRRNGGGGGAGGADHGDVVGR
jgi:hypothetical protein